METLETKEPEQLNQIIKPVKLIICSRCVKEKKHYSKGLCRYCYKYIHLNKVKHKECIKRWKEKHPSYFRDYYHKHKLNIATTNE